MELSVDQLWILLDVFIAAVLSSAIGGEREQLDKPAGLRTNMIVASISCFFVSVSPTLADFIQNNIHSADAVGVDPTRILQAIVVGVSFIGAGTILKSKDENSVQNLTTASTLLYSAGIGIAVAVNYYILAIGLTLIILIINSLHYVKNLMKTLKGHTKD
jgi:putative Mg2+ transporter-C (MgtC) family protein